MRAAPLLVLFGLAGCLAGVGADQPPAPDAPAPGVVVSAGIPRSAYSRFAVIQNSCAPWDGAAVDLRLSPTVSPTFEGSSIVVSVWRSREEVSGGTFQFPDDTGRIGAAIHCKDPDSCEPIESGTVHFDPFTEGKPATGTFDLLLKGGRHERGAFSATWSEVRGRCG